MLVYKESMPESFLPSLAEVEQGIDFFNIGTWQKYDSNESIDSYVSRILLLLLARFKIQPLLSLPHPGPPFPTKFFRCRPYDTLINPNLIREHSYPPIQSCTIPQRVNLPFHPVFYSSENAATALWETVKGTHSENMERDYCVTLWELRSHENLIVTPFFYDNERMALKEICDRILSRQFPAKVSGDRVEAFQKLLRFYSEQFLNDNSSYSISSFLGHQHLYARHQFRTDLFLYPSIMTGKKSMNIAIHPNIVDDNMSLKYLLILQVKKIEQENVKIQPQRYGIVSKSMILWKEASMDDDGYKDIMTKHFNVDPETIIKTFKD